MFVEKQKVLTDALIVLNKEDQPWEVIIERDSIIAKWKWMDARFFGIGEVTDEAKEFAFKVTLDDKGRYKETDSSKSTRTNVDLLNNKISFGSSFFKGRSIGKDKQIGENDKIKFKFETNIVKEPIRNYLKNCGYKKADLFFLKYELT